MAEADRGRGFCLLGNIPVAVMRARALGLVRRVAILDWDVHHGGNGQQAAFYDDPDVLTVSIHQAGNYPLDTGDFDELGEGRGPRCQPQPADAARQRHPPPPPSVPIAMPCRNWCCPPSVASPPI